MNEHDEHPTIDSPTARVHALAGSLYYVALLNRGLATERLFETLPLADQVYFERVVTLALEAAACWRLADEAPAVTPVAPARTLALVPRPEAS